MSWRKRFRPVAKLLLVAFLVFFYRLRGSAIFLKAEGWKSERLTMKNQFECRSWQEIKAILLTFSVFIVKTRKPVVYLGVTYFCYWDLSILWEIQTSSHSFWMMLPDEMKDLHNPSQESSDRTCRDKFGVQTGIIKIFLYSLAVRCSKII